MHVYSKKMANAYDEFKDVLGEYEKASQAYEKISHFSDAREAAVKFAVEENNETAVRDFSNPNIPIETVTQGLRLSLSRRNTRLDELVEDLFLLRVKAETVQRNQRVLLVQNTHHDRFTMSCRQGVHAEVDLATGEAHPDATVLRDTTLRNVHAGHDFQPRNDRRLGPLRRLGHHL